MMEKKRIVEEGLLEQYLIGDLPLDQQLEVEQLLEKDASLRKEYEQMEASFEALAFEQSITPPSEVKDQLKTVIEKKSSNTYQKFAFPIAAGLALLFGFSTFWMFTKWQSTETDLRNLQNQTSSLQSRIQSIEDSYQTVNANLENINNGQVIPVVLYGNQKAPGSRVVAYVNHDQKIVFVNPETLPPLPADKTYQMWSDVEGEMIDMGLLDSKKNLIELKYIEAAESLNITIEPAGGNDHPTVSELVSYVTL
ncbi:MAG: anti-sigma factor [Bacteroidota bacterium]